MILTAKFHKPFTMSIPSEWRRVILQNLAEISIKALHGQEWTFNKSDFLEKCVSGMNKLYLFIFT